MSDSTVSANPPAAPPPHAGPLRISLRTATILLVFSLVFTALMAWVYQLTGPTIEATQQEAKRRLIAEVLPPADYDNDLLADTVELPPIPAIGLNVPTRLYRARRGDDPVALVLEAAERDGYS